MKKTFPFLYGFFLLAQFLIGQLSIPGLPLNILQVTTILILSSCIIIDRKIPNNKYLSLYFLFLFFFLLSALISGYTSSFINLCKSQLIISFTIFWATKILITNYSSLLPIFIPTMIVGVIDSIVTMFQAIGKPIISPVLVMLMQKAETTEVIADGSLGISISGLYLNPVFNGHTLLFCFICSLFIMQGRYKLLGLSSSAIILVGLFFCQQRSAFYLSILTTAFVGLKVLQKNLKTKLVAILILITAIFYLIPYIESYALESGSRILSTNNDSREVIWSAAIKFIQENIFFGGYDKFIHETGKYPHNLILSAFIAGGIFGGIILMTLVAKLLVEVLKSFRYYDTNNSSLLISGCLIGSIIADSLTHNTGLVEADFATFLAMGLCCYYNLKDPKKRFNCF